MCTQCKLLSTYQSTRRHAIPDHSNLHQQLCNKLKPPTDFFKFTKRLKITWRFVRPWICNANVIERWGERSVGIQHFVLRGGACLSWNLTLHGEQRTLMNGHLFSYVKKLFEFRGLRRFTAVFKNSKSLVPMLGQINPSPQHHTLMSILILSSRITQYAEKIINELTVMYRNSAHPIVFKFPSVTDVQVSNFWFWASFDLCLIWKRHAMAHTCITIHGTQLYYNPWRTTILQFLAHSCIAIVGTQLYPYFGIQMYYYYWHTALLQFLAHSCITILVHRCITILVKKLYYNSWHTAVLQFLAHRCITIPGSQLCYNSWQTVVLQFLVHSCVTVLK
jgi:hypothetical protein